MDKTQLDGEMSKTNPQQALDQEEEAHNVDLNKSAVNVVIEVILINLFRKYNM